jgi:hypothetical protein
MLRPFLVLRLLPKNRPHRLGPLKQIGDPVGGLGGLDGLALIVDANAGEDEGRNSVRVILARAAMRTNDVEIRTRIGHAFAVKLVEFVFVRRAIR